MTSDRRQAETLAIGIAADSGRGLVMDLRTSLSRSHPGVVKRLGDCTADDVLARAELLKLRGIGP